MVQNRTITFEISGCREGRWLTDSVREDEQAAMRYARSLLQSGYYEEVKILRQRMGAGTKVETLVLHEKAPSDAQKPLTVTGNPDKAPVCDSIEAFFGAESRMAIQGLMQQYLDKFQISAIELLHNWTYIRKLNDDNASLMLAAVHKVAISQATRQQVDTKDRILALQRLVEETMRKAKAFAASRRNLPKFDPADPDASLAWAEQQGGPDSDYLFAQIVCQWLFGFGSQGGKIEQVQTAIAKAEHPQVQALLDSVVAELFSGGKLIDEIFFQQHGHRGTALGVMADMLTGRLPENATKLDPLLIAFAELNKQGRVPETAKVLTAHLSRQLGTGKPLDPRSPEGDERLFDTLMGKLRDSNGRLLGGIDTQQAVAGYKLKHRQRNLRRIGMEDAADALAHSWSPELIDRLIPLVKG
jgi:hypothetical protein